MAGQRVPLAAMTDADDRIFRLVLDRIRARCSVVQHGGEHLASCSGLAVHGPTRPLPWTEALPERLAPRAPSTGLDTLEAADSLAADPGPLWI